MTPAFFTSVFCFFSNIRRQSNQADDLVLKASWWVAAILTCSLAMLLTIPARLKDRLEEIVPFLNVWLSVVFTVLVWLTFSWAANELNEVFRIPASLLPKALIALTFVLVIAIAGIALGVVAAFFQILVKRNHTDLL